MVPTTICRALLLVGVILTAQLCGCTAYVAVGDGFSAELIHRDSVKSPYHDPALTVHARVLAAVRRSTSRAAALARSYVADGAVSAVYLRLPFEYIMAVNVGTPSSLLLAVVDTGSNLVWLKCGTNDADVVFVPSSSSTYRLVGCNTAACRAVGGAYCDDNANCVYHKSYGYGDGSCNTTGLLSTETFTFHSFSGGCYGCRHNPNVLVPNVNFGCSSSTNTTFITAGFVGLGPGSGSLVSQLGADTSFGRRFSYCLPAYSSYAPSALNFGARAAVAEPGAATAALIHSDRGDYYTVVLASIKIGNASYTVPNLSNVIIDSGTTVTFLDPGLLNPMVEELTRRIGLPTWPSPVKLLQLCYNVRNDTARTQFEKNVPDVTLYLALGVFAKAVTLKLENTFAEVNHGIRCLAMVPVSKEQPLSILGNIAQLNMHVGYDLDKGTVTFAPAKCNRTYTPPHVHGSALSEAHNV